MTQSSSGTNQCKHVVPRVSIAMGIYNCEDTLQAAVNSLQAQTFRDFELIMCDDGSTDGTLGLAKKLAEFDSRIKVIANKSNLGLNHALNHCLKFARGEYYARMDGDDLSEVNRLEKLLAKLDDEPDLALVSSWMTTFDAAGTWGIVRTLPNPTAKDFLRGSPFCHAPCMMRTDVLRNLGGYGTADYVRRSEDLDLWFRLYAAGYRGANIQEPLYAMRDDRNARNRRTLRSRFNEAVVLWRGFRMLKLPRISRIRALRPILVGLLPGCIYDSLHRRRLSPHR